MVQANELRIGNWVNFYHSISGETKPVQIWPEWFCNSADINDTSPIPLTPEILEKAGFECYGVYPDGFSSYIKKGVEVHLPYFEFCYSDSDYKTEIKYLHQLQNLYFALTGEELQIEL